ncbi:hypothetical protein M0804_003744 [Polistes exclamans]|nr:hypothetical protein M0804_003744 [Polistes exclamans]
MTESWCLSITFQSPPKFFSFVRTFATQVSYQVNYRLLGYSSMRALDVADAIAVAIAVAVVASDGNGYGSGGSIAFAITSISICVTCLIFTYGT